MKRISLSLIFCAGLLVMGCKNEKKEKEEMDQSETEMSATDMNTEDAMETDQAKTAVAQLEATSGSNLSGKVTFTQENGKVTMKAEINGLKEGKHAIHIHEAGDCSASDGTSAKGHWNPTDEPHGKWGSSDGYHKGDIGNFETDKDGKGTLTFSTDEWCLGCDDPNKNILGKAIIVHEGVDDFTSQPSGAAGKRVGCGVIKEGM